MKDRIQMYITLIVISTYIYLVITKAANVEGFVMLATYIIKKAMDIIEEQPK